MATSSIFSGSSRYSADLKSAIDRSIAIASLPISQLNQDKTALESQATALTSLGDQFAGLQTAVDQLSSALSGSFYTASVSDPNVLSATIGTGALEGIYKVEVKDAGAYASSMSPASWSGGSSATSYQLKLGTQTFDFTAENNQAATVAAAINAQAGSVVRATVVNVGPASAPDYRISLQATKLGNLTPQLLKSGVDVVSEQSVGRLASYVVNQSGVDVTSDSRAVTIATGISVNLATSKATPVEITVTRSSSAVSDALSAFATAYNTTLAAVDEQRGSNDGALNGQPLVFDLSRSLRSLVTYSSDGSSVGGLAALGLELQNDGTLQFNQFEFLAADLANSAGVASFLGSSTKSGFLKAATDGLKAIQASSTGILAVAEGAVAAQQSDLEERIALQQERIDRLTERLQNQMAAADALIASMEQRYNQISTMFESMRVASEQYA